MVKRRAARKSARTAESVSTEYCDVCGGNCREKNANLPGYLLIAFGLLLFPINFDMIPGIEWAKAWPLVLVLFGFVYIAKVTICRKISKKS